MGARAELLAIPDDLLRTGEVAEAVLVFMDFSTGAKRWWAGFGPLDHAGYIWEGVGDMISISDLSTDYQMSADPVTFQMAATEEMLTLVRGAKSAVTGRQVIVYSQLFATTQINGVGPWQPMAQPMPLFVGSMGPMSYEANGPSSLRVSLQCEGLWARRNAPPRGLLTDRDQQARHPGDVGLERVALYTNYEIKDWI